MSTTIFPLEVWPEGILQARLPANDNALRVEVLARPAKSFTASAPASPADGDVYIVSTAWGGFSVGDVVLRRGGAWYGYAPYPGWLKFNQADNKTYRFSETWSEFGGSSGGGSTQGKQAIAVSAGSIRPSLTAGCASLAPLNMGANQPDIATLNFDPATQEYAQFSIPMPKKWDAGTITARFRWSHAATTTNFGVVWALQALAVGDDDAMAAAFGTAVSVTDTGGTTNDLYVSAETAAITAAGSAAKSDTLFFRVYRVAADGADTLAIDARLHGIDIFVATNADTDA